jgi:hypothetical protein
LTHSNCRLHPGLCQHRGVHRLKPFTTVIVTLTMMAVFGVWWLFSTPTSPGRLFVFGSPPGCGPVQEMLSYNRTEIEKLNAKTSDPALGSFEKATKPSEMDYRAWVDGLTDRAAKVTDPDLAGPAKEAAATASRLVQAQIDFDEQSARTAPGAQQPAVAMVVTAFNDQYRVQISQLAKSCPT